MSNRKRRKSIFDLFDEIFSDLIKEIDDEFREFVRKAERLGPISEEGIREVRGPYIYGFRVTIGPDGIPRIEEFGNVRRRGIKPVISEEREPLVDVIDEGNKVRIIAEIPGVEKDRIKLRVQGKKLFIKASNEKRKYYKEVDLPAEVNIKEAKATYRNGVLEVEIPKKETEGGFEIKVE